MAIDLGASSGRGMLARFDGERIVLEEQARFSNGPVVVGSALHWDLPGILSHVEAMITSATVATGGSLASVGVDTWGVDYGLLDGAGVLLGLPFAYRDHRTDGMVAQAHRHISAEALYAVTGCQTIPFNTAFQLLSERGGPRWDTAATVLMLPDLIAHHLTGEIAAERSAASTTQLYDPAGRCWATSVIDALGLPRGWFPPLMDPGTVTEPLRVGLASRIAARSALRLARVAGHDTASAFAATPDTADALVISLGTWSLVGVERDRPLITGVSRAANLSNEVGVGGTIRLLRNAAGLWLLQGCRATWGGTPSWAELETMAAAAPAHRGLIDPDDPRLLRPADMPAEIRAACIDAGFPPPETPGDHARVVIESLALRYRTLVEQVESVVGHRLPTIRIVGGGARSPLLCQATADATGRPVVAGPAEATALGNAGVQLMSLGHLSGLADLREVIARSVARSIYEPTIDRAPWDAAATRFASLSQC